MSFMTAAMKVEVQPVEVSVTAPGTGLRPDQLAQMCTDKIVFVGPDVPPAIRDQALAFKDKILLTTRHYIAQAQKSERTQIIGQLEQAGFTDAANLLRTL